MKIIKSNKIKIHSLIEMFFIITTLVMLIATFSVGIYFNKYEEEEKQKNNIQKIHGVLSQLIIPSLVISDFSEVRRLLYMASGDEETFLVVDNEGTIIMPDYGKNNFSNFISNTSSLINDCKKAETVNKYINGKKYIIHCSTLKNNDELSLGKDVGFLLSFTNHKWITVSPIIFYFAGILVVFFLLLIFLFRKMLHYKLLQPLVTLKDSILTVSMSGILSNPHIVEIKNAPMELIEIKEAFERLLLNLQDEYGKRIEAERAQALIDLAAQVAHDIRSPLAAINTAISSIASIPEERRVMIKNAVRRINDIANNLLMQSRNNNDELKNVDYYSEKEILPELIFVVLDNIISEKKYEYYKTKVRIDLEIEECAYNCFSNINQASFKRVLSNLINNSIEAINLNGVVTVSLKGNREKLEITITDNGCGIPKDILPKVTDHGFSFRKQKGAGFGLSYAKQQIDQLNGKLYIQSEEGMGTKVIINLLPSDPPYWFCEKLDFHNNDVIVILDDDPSIHDAWNVRLSFIPDVRVYHFTKASDLINSKINFTDVDYYLFDYELLIENKSGLDVIEEFNFNSKAILVTSCFEDSIVRNRCKKMGVKIIPKSYVPYIPIQLYNNRSNEFVFIDDDESMRMVWSFAAEEAGKHMSTYSSVDEFNKFINTYDKDTIIYIDSDLGNNIKGELLAKELYASGFTEIHLTTGHTSDMFSPMPWIKSIVGKQPPFSLTCEN